MACFRPLSQMLAAAAVCLGMLASPAAAFTSGPRYASIVTDARSGEVLSGQNIDETRHPASLTKMMTLYMLFDALRDGRMTLASPIRFSAEAASRPPSKLGVPVGGSISAEGAILALVTRSANDVAAAVGEAISGSEEAFARAMTQRARQMGMSRTTFRNASGLPDPEQVTTARDMALLGRRLIQDFPDRYHYFSVTHFQHGERLIRNHNGMLLDYPGADGIKTGFINASGFNIVTSAQRDGVRLVGAVFGGRGWAERNAHMAELFDAAFQRQGVRSVPPLAGQPRVMAARAAGASVSPALQARAEAQARARLASTRAEPAARPATRMARRQPNAARVQPAVATRPAQATRNAAARPAPAQAARPASATRRTQATPSRPSQARPAQARSAPARQTQPAARPATRSTEAPRAAGTRVASN